jgi:hypothetical protein
VLVSFVGDTHFETAYPKVLFNFPQLLQVNTLSDIGTSAPPPPPKSLKFFVRGFSAAVHRPSHSI